MILSWIINAAEFFEPGAFPSFPIGVPCRHLLTSRALQPIVMKMLRWPLLNFRPATLKQLMFASHLTIRTPETCKACEVARV